ncbi:MAG TPA: YggS family pyridoxal phosphate-dependent enzyme [Bacillota bacterium]|nr:YggS family pyridoxal phosphate-dependent enzyme [Bacillota bacterium]HQB80748.1 YggS family pyridoxal phosphate-dependent enzyme [Bacillota bacterium]
MNRRIEINEDRSQTIGRNLEELIQSIRLTALEAGRDPDSVRLVAVTKNFPASDVEAAFHHGQRVFGENRAQELVAKASELDSGVDCEWHMIGTLQTNKVKYLTGLVSLIHSVDSLRLLETIQRRAERMALVQDVLLQVNVSGEDSKHGFSPSKMDLVLQERGNLSHVRIRGLMTMAPFFDDPERARPVFAQLRLLRDQLSERHGMPQLAELSMGMTADYKQAIAEGATIVRIGSAIFGQRTP